VASKKCCNDCDCCCGCGGGLAPCGRRVCSVSGTLSLVDSVGPNNKTELESIPSAWGSNNAGRAVKIVPDSPAVPTWLPLLVVRVLRIRQSRIQHQSRGVNHPSKEHSRKERYLLCYSLSNSYIRLVIRGSGEIFIRESAKRSFAFGQFGVKIETRDCESRGTP
jgi:hypothetical protein